MLSCTLISGTMADACVIVIDEHQARRLMYGQRSCIDQNVRLMSVMAICICQTDTTCVLLCYGAELTFTCRLYHFVL